VLDIILLYRKTLCGQCIITITISSSSSSSSSKTATLEILADKRRIHTNPHSLLPLCWNNVVDERYNYLTNKQRLTDREHNITHIIIINKKIYYAIIIVAIYSIIYNIIIWKLIFYLTKY